ncbi:histidinol-phosphatase [Ruminococcaceae bacterium OttesenSCG-928-L11]|nr:histidinol-phosphatase [Ruminococcaceae bacterium OttesenSCG-928-L11]
MDIYENYHSHTFRCKHAQGDVLDYVLQASRSGIRRLGIADHTPLPDDWSLGMRMSVEELPGYVDAFAMPRHIIPQVKLYMGMECDYLPKYHSFFKDELLGRYQFDYLAGSIHAFPYQGEICWIYGGDPMTVPMLRAYADTCVAAIESGLFAFIAHPDVFGVSMRRWDPEIRACSRYIVEAAASAGVPLELNTSGYEKARKWPTQFSPACYPIEQFWEIAAETPIRVVVNSDAHVPESLTADLDTGYRLMEKYGLEKAVLFP